jgi:hypothetical protein
MAPRLLMPLQLRSNWHQVPAPTRSTILERLGFFLCRAGWFGFVIGLIKRVNALTCRGMRGRQFNT